MIEILQTLLSGIPENFMILFEIGIMLILAGIFAFLIRLLKQPLIPAYIIAGIILGPILLGVIENTEIILALSEIGVAFLLFYAGLEINFKKLKDTGKIASFTGIIQIIVMLILGFSVALLLGFLPTEAIYIGLVVTFSSTMIVIKLLSDKRQLNTLHGRIILGILLIQDIAAIIALTFLSGNGGFALLPVLFSLLKIIAFVLIAFTLAKFSGPIFEVSAKSSELILLIPIAFLFLFAIGSYFSGLSLIIGAFFAGLALSNSKFKLEIQGGIESIRDFFAIIFFVALGMQLTLFPKNLLSLFFILVFLIIFIKPFLIMLVMKLSGYKKRISFLTGLSLAQTSEFSLIILGQGLFLGQISGELFSMLVLLTIISMSLTTYIMRYDTQLFNALSFPLKILGEKEGNKKEYEYIPNKKNKMILFGCHRMGSLFLDEFSDIKKDILVIDFDPSIINALIEKKISCIYGDFTNKEVLEKANLEGAEVIVGTIPDLQDNLLLIKKIRNKNKNAVIFVSAVRISEAEALYEAGADYVILPQVLGGRKSAGLIKKVMRDKKQVKKIKRDSVKYIQRIHHLLYG